MELSQLIARAVQINGTGIATVCNDRRRTWEETAGRIRRIAGALQQLGVHPDSRVAVLGLNSERYLESLFAIPWAGGIFVPINIRLAVPEMLFQLTDSEANILLVDGAFKALIPELTQGAPSIGTVIYMDGDVPPDGMLAFEEMAHSANGADPNPRGGDDTAGILYTGGTTGRAKGVMVTHGGLIMNAFQSGHILGSTVDMAYAHVVPMFHIGDCAYTVATTLHGGKHVLIPRFDIDTALKILEREQVTHTALVPTMINMLLNHPGFADHDLSALRRIIYGASPIPETLLIQALKALPHTEFAQSYGQTEAITITMLLPEWHATDGPRSGKLKTAGKAAPNVSVSIRNEYGTEAPRGQLGEICVWSGSIMKGYWNRPDATDETIRDGWLHTGDIGVMDADGFVSVVDRVKDMIISGGENIYSVEVEDALYRHPGVLECAVIGIPDPQWGERVHAIVRLKSDWTVEEEELIAHCRGLIAHYKCPRSVELRDDPLPLSGAGKILKKDLRADYWPADERGSS